MDNKLKGKQGEDIAADYLLAKGYTLIARNFRNRFSEIDLIVERAFRMIFVEVKKWRFFSDLSLERKISARTQRRLWGIAEDFISQNPQETIVSYQFDVILIEESTNRIVHLENAFSNEGEK